ncbi:MAG: hypothetical protein A2070_14580 [Bdellovibrionales bacterium GWC1_52_8]|nr:MAG: hypothetical protein A2Z97_12645 [Bdellovibrionales bacterium GWB1_52_6]OFZ04170.1 MAG: hypothetical protein A2X97_15345 [Bdellovibrionales bacterium GWA1_52_35]OFZ33278.1 MAG: hypothetical protein A2070_14580 [Bdellovibrionales bacterium GWC1_52_8]HCM40512.1 hypothetical protein [Bdellovibrionales bacterium]
MPLLSLVGIQFLLSTSLATYAIAATMMAPDFTLAIQERAGTFQVIASPPATTHFNQEAPAWLQITGGNKGGEKLKPSAKTKTSVVFVPQATDTETEFTVSLYLCDEANTFCENHQVKGKLPAVTRKKPELEKKNLNSKQKEKAMGAPAGESKLFILNDPEKAFALAKKEKKPLLIDFFAIWCPPCNLLDSDVFSAPSFAAAAKNFVLLKLDADSEASWAMKEQHKIAGYPTILFATPDSEEISRFAGFRPADVFEKEMTLAWKWRNDPIFKLSGSPDAHERRGLMHLEKGEYEQAISHLKLVPSKQEQLLLAEIGKLKAGNKTGLQAKLEESLRKFPSSLGSLENRQLLAELFEENGNKNGKRKTLQDLIATASALIAKPESLKGAEATLTDVQGMLAEAYEETGQADLAKKVWSEAAEQLKKEIQHAKKDLATERGRNLERAYCLWKSGRQAEADAVYTQLEQRYPEEFTFYYAHASMKLKLDDVSAAIPLGQKALKSSYGDNRLRSALLYAKTLKAAKRIDEARTVIRQTIAEAKVPATEAIRSGRYLQALRDFEKTL